MRKLSIYCAILLASVISTMSFTACSSDADKAEEIEREDKPSINVGEYVLTVTQTGDMDKYDIHATVGGTTLEAGRGVWDNVTGEEKGLVYQLTPEETHRPSYSYKTSDKGVMIGIAMGWSPKFEEVLENIENPLIVTVVVTYNGKEIERIVWTEDNGNNSYTSQKF